METSNTQALGYVDISGIQKPSNIRTERELEIEISKICETLKDNCKISLMSLISIASYDWKKRTESLKRVQEISMLFDDVVDGAVNISGQYYLTQHARLFAPLTA